MKKTLFSLTLLLVLIPGLTNAQQITQPISLFDAVSAAKFPDRMYELQWISDEAFVYTTDFSVLKMWENGETTDFLTGEELIPEGLEAYPGVDGLRFDSDTDISYLKGGSLIRMNLEDREAEVVLTLSEEAEHIERSPKMAIAYVIDGNVYVTVPGEDSPRMITDDASADLVYGEAAHRSEFGITKGLFWSPDGTKLAFYRIDQSNIPDYPLIDQQVIPATTNNIRYPMAGQASQIVTFGIYDLESQETVYLDTEEGSDQYLTNITWSPDNQKVYLAIVNRGQDHLWLTRFDASSGEEEAVLFEETDEQYVEPEHGLMFVPESDNEFLWFSERDGYQHLYHYAADGQLIRQTTSGEFDVEEFLGFSQNNESILVSARAESPLESHLYRVELAGMRMIKLSDEHGSHSATVSPSGDRIIDTWSSTDVPRRANLISSKKGKVEEELFESDNPFEGLEVGQMEIITLAGEGGTPLYGRIIKPADFDETKQYPAIVYVYGGPHVQLVQDRWMGGASMYLYYLAQQGYVVWTLDNRGTPGRGIDFEQETFRQLGTKEVQDQETGVTYLKSLPFVDADRIGVHGWSYGGFMTTSLLTKGETDFKVGVAGGPVIDWHLYEVMYTERYMDTPEENPTGYEEAALIDAIDNLESKLLIIHGQQDDVVVPQHSFQYVRKAVERGIQLDYFPYPTHEHNVRGRDRMHLLEKITEYFDQHL